MIRVAMSSFPPDSPPEPTVDGLSRIMLSWLPAVFIVGLAGVAIWGESGLMVRDRLEVQLAASLEERAAMDRDNRRLLRELRTMEEDDVVLERVVAEELGLVQPGSTLVRFHDAPRTP